MIQLTLDASVLLEWKNIESNTWGLLELQTREYLLKIHARRLAALKGQ